MGTHTRALNVAAAEVGEVETEMPSSTAGAPNCIGSWAWMHIPASS